MWGTCGWVARERDLAGGTRAGPDMTANMACRGADTEGKNVDTNTALGHRRLAVIDLPAGHPPMTIVEDDHPGRRRSDLQRRDLRQGGEPLTPPDRARLLLARALLDDPPLFVLDHLEHELGENGRTQVRDLLVDYPGIVVLASETPEAVVTQPRWDAVAGHAGGGRRTSVAEECVRVRGCPAAARLESNHG